jgi:hypothetical protein
MAMERIILLLSILDGASIESLIHSFLERSLPRADRARWTTDQPLCHAIHQIRI